MKLVTILLFMLFCLQITHAQPITPRDPDDISGIQWSHDASKLAIGYYNGHFQVFNTSDMTLIFQDNHANIPVRFFGWSPSGTRLAVGYLEGAIDIWDMTTRIKELSIPVGKQGSGSLTWSFDENYLFVSGDIDMPTLRKYDMNNGSLVDSFWNGAIVELVFINDGNQVVALDYDFIIFINPNDLTREFFPIDNPSQPLPLPRATAISLHPSQAFIAIGHSNYQVAIWDLETKQITTILDAGMPFNDIYGVTDLAFNATGTRLFAVTYEGIIRSWDTSTWQLIEETDIDGLILNADFSPDAGQLAFGDLEQDAQIFIRDLCDFVAPDVTTLLNIMSQANTFGEEAQICLAENATYTLTASLPDITGDITLIGNGAQIVMTGGNRIFNVTATGSLHLKNVMLSDGVADDGGAIYNAGDLTLDDVILQNHSAVRGGAIYNAGNLVMNGGAIQNNSASEFGGGIYNIGDMQLDGVNIRDNNASQGSGVYQGE